MPFITTEALHAAFSHNRAVVLYSGRYFYIVDLKQTKSKQKNFTIMKSKLFIATAVLLAIAVSSFAAAPAATNSSAINQLKSEFKDAANITWSSHNNLTQASFTWNGQQLHAFYNDNGDQIAVSREVSEDKLPLKALQSIKAKYEGYKTAEAIEYNSAEEGLSYYVSLVSNNKKVILNISPEGLVSVFK
jgi:hypothetical protein